MEAHLSQDQPSPWVVRFAPLIPAGTVLDLACGGGRHARWLAARGCAVLAVDRDPAALIATAAPGIVTRAVDLELPGAENESGWPLRPAQFSGIVVVNYLHRPLMRALLDSLQPGGVLIYETFAAGNGQFGKPSNPDFLLKPGELLHWASEPACRVIAYEDGYQQWPRPAMVQRICVHKARGEPAPEALKLDGGIAV